MKTFNIKVNKTTNDTSNNTNFDSYIDNLVLSNVKKITPYIFTSDTDEEYIIKPKKAKTINIDITIPKKTTFRTSIKDKYSEFIKAVNYLAGKSYDTDTYDFKMIDGTPVKIFDDEIQIGYDLIPLNAFTLDLYNKLSAESKKSIIDIYINIKK